MARIAVNNQTHPLTRPLQVTDCRSFFERLRGLMFHAPIAQDDGALLDQQHDSKVDASIHMFFVSFDLGVIWLDSHYRVVDTRLARSWRPFYFPVQPARYVLEVHPARLGEFTVGDTIHFEGSPLA
jgi:uncharacterized protein